MGAILGGTMRAPFTAILFALELTHDINVLLPLLVAAMLAHATTVLLLKRSILTEKVARRGFHITREYATDPLEILFVREVMRTKLVVLPADATVEQLRHTILREPAQRGQHLYPVVDGERLVSGVITRKQLRALTQSSAPEASLGQIVRKPVVARPDEPLRVVVFRMAETGFTRMPVVENDSGKLVGMISLDDLLLARVRNLNEERHRERPLQLRFPFRSRREPEPGRETA
jgi:CBS domain-containing protein